MESVIDWKQFQIGTDKLIKVFYKKPISQERAHFSLYLFFDCVSNLQIPLNSLWEQFENATGLSGLSVSRLQPSVSSHGRN